MGKNSYSYQCSLIFLHMKGECNKTMLTVTIYCVRKKEISHGEAGHQTILFATSTF